MANKLSSLLYFKHLLLIPLLLGCASCMCYQSYLIHDFGEFEYSNVSTHQEITADWNATEILTSDVNMFFMKYVEKDGWGELELAFNKELDKFTSVVITNVLITDSKQRPPHIGELGFPLVAELKEKAVPLFSGYSTEGERIMRDCAEVKLPIKVSTDHSPINIEVLGYYLASNNQPTHFNFLIPMSVIRQKELGGIANCWP